MIRNGKVESVKQRLKNLANKQNKQFNDVLDIYFLERFLYRLSISKYNENFILKGGMLLYVMFNEDYARKTTDIDLLAQKLSNDATEFLPIVKDICSIQTDDPIRFDINNISVKNITEFKKENHGLNVFIPAFLDRTKGMINIDIGFGDVIYPEKIELSFPSLIDEESNLYAYSMETVIAEKLDAIVSLGALNSRLKDFYDIYVISKTYDFDGNILKEAIIETFENRKTPFKHIVAFDDDFISPYKKGQWNKFIKQKDPNHVMELEIVIEYIKRFIEPIIESDISLSKWNHISGEWK